MIIPLYQIDAFAEEVFQGNPAAICPLREWLADEQMQAIAAENNSGGDHGLNMRLPISATTIRAITTCSIYFLLPSCLTARIRLL